MCGIVGACSQRNIGHVLIEGLQRLEYRGYDSSGVSFLKDGELHRTRRVGKVEQLQEALNQAEVDGVLGIAHTRWATHGVPSERNAHPHNSNETVSVVHNGIIENHKELREKLQTLGYVFASDTDTEVIAHLMEHELQQSASLREALHRVVGQLEGAYGTVVIDKRYPNQMVAARSGSPLVVGYGDNENFVASDQQAILSVSQRFCYLEEGDIAEVTSESVQIFTQDGQPVERVIVESDDTYEAADKGDFPHYMLKEIYEQPQAIIRTLEERLVDNTLCIEAAFGQQAPELLKDIEHIQIVACGTSYHAGLTAKYWFEGLTGISCQVEIASEFRYRKSFLHKKSLFVTISQSGETADTLAALRLAKEMGYQTTLTLCNSPLSSMVRESDLCYFMKAGPEIGVASTKAFTVQLTGLLLLAGSIAQLKTPQAPWLESLANSLRDLPTKIEQVLALSDAIKELSASFADKHHALFLGRGEQYPIAMEGALKLKEISYIHAEAYAAGELKHGPLALIDADMPVVVVAPNNQLLDKLHSNIEEVRARGGLMYVFADENSHFVADNTMKVLDIPHCDPIIEPILYTIPLQLLSYHVALIKGTDIDQPRNLAKSVTVE